MILFIALAVLVAKLRGNGIRTLFREISLLPLWLLELVFWFFQIAAWMGDFRFIRYAQLLQQASILVLIWPILKFRLYTKAVIGSLMTVLGSVMNSIVMKANNGKMPVYPTLSNLTRYYRAGVLNVSGDLRHVMMSAETRLNALADYIDVGFSIMSLGDLLIHGFTSLIVYGVIIRLNQDKEGKEDALHPVGHT